jgi:hypothetical protein
MPWTFVRFSELVEARKQYEADFAERAASDVARLKGFALESASQRIATEKRDWTEFNREVREFEGNRKSDPTKLNLISEQGTRFHYYEFCAHGFTLVYHCDAHSEIARPVIFYRDVNWIEKFYAFWRRHKS